MVKLTNIVKSFDEGNVEALKSISLDICEGEFLTILGPSGCGKTTTLRIVAGFEQPSSGSVLIDNEEVATKAPYERNVNTVFQSYALFPHMNIFDNIAFGLNLKKVPKEEIKNRVKKMLKTVQMEGYENRMPDQLSGGQKQRVAIARAIINNPKVLLLDEPLGALDLKLRKQMQVELKHLQQKLGITFVYVTHDQEEALTMSDRICVMNKGQIEQLGTPDEIYERPRTKFVADFIGETNLFEGKTLHVDNEKAMIELNDGQQVCINDNNLVKGESVCFAVRPERLKLKAAPESGDSWIKARLKERIYIGSALRTILTLSTGKNITVNEPAGENYVFSSENPEIFITWNPKNAVVIKS
jgi:spermidine/putrescine transport system ATP-binding protein